MRERGKQLAGYPPVDDPSVAWHDVVVDGPHGPIPTRIFTPTAKASRPRAIYLHTHGGGYVMWGGLDVPHNLNTATAKDNDCIVVAPDFRLPPEHPFPVPLEDCFAAFQWTAKNAAAIGGRPGKICIGGGCTGGNLAAAVTLMARDAGGPMPAAQCLQATVFDARCEYLSMYENSEGYMLSRDDDQWVIEQYLQDMEHRFDWRASPILAKTMKGLPPTLIRVGEWDVLRDEGIAYANRCRDAGVDVTLTLVPGESHSQNPQHAREAAVEMAAFLKKYVGPDAA
ncbi:MAG: alpha/beta hydrolase [Alphaproteobacteria bacterium]|nr:alpha/beta hydrolase [Alphaproteobacteria bacterium]